MAEKLDAKRIEKARKEKVRTSKGEEEKQRIRDTIELNRSGKRVGRLIEPKRKEYGLCQKLPAHSLIPDNQSVRNDFQIEGSETFDELCLHHQRLL